ncbi:MAG: DNA topoisomerase IV subunit A [Verrucomicrobiota bacterium]|jgi:DNA gyrase subunit A|nr:DNA topoisomerase IV subunit A [Verrucomicrobiota bacterium]HCF94910.1 DNA topoisomerase [Verrucomicrobiota bacterium]
MARKKKTTPESTDLQLDNRGIIQDVSFHETTRQKYLNYAMSVITARALPDVRDGLKPVQRRILYTMQNELHLAPPNKPLKCARIVGDVLGKFHPHGDVAVYEALVRMAQDFSLRCPLVDGHGNFGSIDGDGPAAYRYTEARLQPIALELLEEIPKETVPFRPNYDGKTQEPVVLPARIPNLLVNGATGIAVGMATNIPPHNLGEIINACDALILNRSLTVDELMVFIQGPDFPTGGKILNTSEELAEIYHKGRGSVRVCGEYTTETEGRTRRIVITSIPYMVQKDALVRAIGELVISKKLPHLSDVRDESTTEIRIVLELKREASPETVMAFIYKHTPLQSNFNVNLTCLIPVDGDEEACIPAQLDLRQILLHFVDFRYQVVERRFRHELRLLKERIHILEGLHKIFGDLDEAIRIIRTADDRNDASAKLQARFAIDAIQADAVLELRLYRLAKMEIQAILDELHDKQQRAAKIEIILESPRKKWNVVRDELLLVAKSHGNPRRTVIAQHEPEPEYNEEAFIVDEDVYVVLSKDGWIKRMGSVSDPSKIRVRQGDEVDAIVAGNTRCTVTFFTNFGTAYTARIADIPASRGHGNPIQGLFNFSDGEQVVRMIAMDPRLIPDLEIPQEELDPNGANRTDLFILSSSGYSLRSAPHLYAEPSNRNGRKYAKLREGEEVVNVHLVTPEDILIIATVQGRVILFPCEEVSLLNGPGRGVIAIKLDRTDRVLGSVTTHDAKEGMRVVTTRGREVHIRPQSYSVTSRAGKGLPIIRRGGLTSIAPVPLEVPTLPGMVPSNQVEDDDEQ